MKNDLISIILIFLIFIFLIWVIKDKIKNNKWFIEGMEGKSKIILTGDNVLNNIDYIKKDNIRDLMEKERGIVIAETGATINKLEQQLNRIPKKFNNIGTKIFISIGANDLYNHYKNNNKADYKKIDDMYKKYKNILNKFKKKYNKVRLILCDTFHGTLEDDFKPVYDKWNEKIYEYGEIHNHKIFKLSKILNKKLIEYKIEPNKEGGETIVKNIIKEKY
jgi:shikimate kinase